jgi:hypothetical protein
VVFFDDKGQEVFRLEAYVRPFHFASSFEYIASGAYRKEPEFQRFLQNKTEHMKERGEKGRALEVGSRLIERLKAGMRCPAPVRKAWTPDFRNDVCRVLACHHRPRYERCDSAAIPSPSHPRCERRK